MVLDTPTESPHLKKREGKGDGQGEGEGGKDRPHALAHHIISCIHLLTPLNGTAHCMSCDCRMRSETLSFYASCIPTAVCFEHVGARTVLTIDRLVEL